MVNALGAIVGVLVIAGAIAMFVTRGPRHRQVAGKLWKLIAVALLALLVIGYLRVHSR